MPAKLRWVHNKNYNCCHENGLKCVKTGPKWACNLAQKFTWNLPENLAQILREKCPKNWGEYYPRKEQIMTKRTRGKADVQNCTGWVPFKLVAPETCSNGHKSVIGRPRGYMSKLFADRSKISGVKILNIWTKWLEKSDCDVYKISNCKVLKRPLMLPDFEHKRATISRRHEFRILTKMFCKKVNGKCCFSGHTIHRSEQNFLGVKQCRKKCTDLMFWPKGFSNSNQMDAHNKFSDSI